MAAYRGQGQFLQTRTRTSRSALLSARHALAPLSLLSRLSDSGIQLAPRVDGWCNCFSAVGAVNENFSWGIFDSATLFLGFPAVKTPSSLWRGESKCVGCTFAH
ncbi:hypothetical protein GOODEAATRI_003171 [Goodea atripinnis]|uniref:Uncharacterized protein n=1 Tax=Goodea atripinnis TaxID=208336 RepID=A0ABV0PB63_9TELE